MTTTSSFTVNVGLYTESEGHSYTVHLVPQRGIVITGAIPIDDLVALTRLWTKDGWTITDCLLAKQMNACLVVTNTAAGDRWRAELGIGVEAKKK
jgi:hypothetical protein